MQLDMQALVQLDTQALVQLLGSATDCRLYFSRGDEQPLEGMSSLWRG